MGDLFQAGQGVIFLNADTKGMAAGFSSATSMATGFMSRMAAIAAPLAGFFALKSAFSGASEQEEAERKLAGALMATGESAGWSAEQIKKLATERQRVTTLGDDKTIDAAAKLVTFTNITGAAFEGAMTAAQDMAAVMGTDLSGSIMQVGKALNDPIQGVSALSRAGVQFTEQQKEQIKTLVESGNLMGAQNVVLAEMKRQFGGVAEVMAKGPVGAFKQLKNAAGDAMESFATAVMKGGEPLFRWLTPGMERLGELLGEVGGWAASGFGEIGAEARKLFDTLNGGMFDWSLGFKGVLDTFVVYWKTIFLEMQATFTGFVQATVGAMADMFDAIGVGPAQFFKEWSNELKFEIDGIRKSIDGLSNVKPELKAEDFAPFVPAPPSKFGDSANLGGGPGGYPKEPKERERSRGGGMIQLEEGFRDAQRGAIGGESIGSLMKQSNVNQAKAVDIAERQLAAVNKISPLLDMLNELARSGQFVGGSQFSFYTK